MRQAIGLALDFEWMNRQLFYGLYKRVKGYFRNSEFHAEGLPQAGRAGAARAVARQARPEVFGPAPISPSTAPPGSLRENLRRARTLLAEAGWTYRDGALRNQKGEAFTIEFLNDQPSLIRVATPFQTALQKLGIQMSFRTVDFALYQQRMDKFEFDITTVGCPAPQPGRRTAGDVRLQGSRHRRLRATSGALPIPAVDALLQKVVGATTRPELSAAMRALDRVLSHGYYSVPQYYGDAFLIGYDAGAFVLPDADAALLRGRNWAMSTWWASPSNK